MDSNAYIELTAKEKLSRFCFTHEFMGLFITPLTSAVPAKLEGWGGLI
jgi:hypothetical protein